MKLWGLGTARTATQQHKGTTSTSSPGRFSLALGAGREKPRPQSQGKAPRGRGWNNIISCNFDRDSERKKQPVLSANSKIKSVADNRLLVLECLTFSSIEKNILTTRDNLFTLSFAQIPVSRANGLKVATPLLNVADEHAQAVSQMC